MHLKNVDYNIMSSIETFRYSYTKIIQEHPDFAKLDNDCKS